MPDVKKFLDHVDEEEVSEFIDRSSFLTRTSWPASTMRVFALLLLSSQPLTLEAIATRLDVSKSAASLAGKQLEDARFVRRLSVRGSRQVAYEMTDSLEMLVHALIEPLRDAVTHFRRAIRLAEPGPAQARTVGLVSLYDHILEALERALGDAVREANA